MELDLKSQLKLLFEAYKDYACFDALSFLGNVHYMVEDQDSNKIVKIPPSKERSEALNEAIEKSIEKVKQQVKNVTSSAADAIQIRGEGGAILGSKIGYDKSEIDKIAAKIEQSKGAICTTFAVAGAQKLLELAESEAFEDKIKRVEVVAMPAGYRGTHCFVIVNRDPSSDIADISTWGNDALVVDPWLASLQNPAVYTVPEFKQSGFLHTPSRLEVNFDSDTPRLKEIRQQSREIKDRRKQDFEKISPQNKAGALHHVLRTHKRKVHSSLLRNTLTGQKEAPRLSKLLETVAAKDLHNPFVELLNDFGYKPGELLSDGNYPLEIAVRHNALSTVERLIEDSHDCRKYLKVAGDRAIPNVAKDNYIHYTKLLEIAVDKKNDEIVGLLLKKMLSSSSLDALDMRAISKIPNLTNDFKPVYRLYNMLHGLDMFERVEKALKRDIDFVSDTLNALSSLPEKEHIRHIKNSLTGAVNRERLLINSEEFNNLFQGDCVKNLNDFKDDLISRYSNIIHYKQSRHEAESSFLRNTRAVTSFLGFVAPRSVEMVLIEDEKEDLLYLVQERLLDISEILSGSKTQNNFMQLEPDWQYDQNLKEYVLNVCQEGINQCAQVADDMMENITSFTARQLRPVYEDVQILLKDARHQLTLQQGASGLRPQPPHLI